MTLNIDKTYKLRPRNQPDARWFVFKPTLWVPAQNAWWGKSSSDQDLILFAHEVADFDIAEFADGDKPRCDCGAVRARTTHAHWCSSVVAAE